MLSMRHRLAFWTVDHRMISGGILLAITLFFAAGLPRVELKTIFSDLFPKTHPFVQTFKDHPNFGNPLTIILMVKNKNGTIYNHETLDKLWRMTREIDLAPSVDHDQILSLTTEKARYAEATPYGVDMKPMMDAKAPETAGELAEFERRVDKAPNVRTFLISADETATLITATFIEHSLKYDETFKFVQDMVERERDEHHEIYAAGAPMLTGWVYTYEVQMLMIFGITAFALVASLLFYMRNVPGVLTPIIVAMTGATWGFGLVGWLKQPIEPLIMVVPLLLVARAFSHCVQFTERYYEIYYEVRDRKKAAQLSLSVMMAPGTLGIITDVLGLGLIAIAPIPVMERFAVFCGFWAAALVPTDVFLSAILISMFKAPGNVAELIGKSDKKTWHHSLIHMLEWVGRLSHGPNAKKTAVVVILVVCTGVYLTTKMKIGNPVEGSNLLWYDSEFNTAVRAINAHFPGVMTLEVVFEGKGDNRILRENHTQEIMHKLQRYLESHPNAPAATLSFADYPSESNRLFSGGNPKWGALDPTDEAVNGAATAMFLGTSAKSYGHVTDFTLQNGTVSLWYKDNKQETVDRALEQTRAALAQLGLDHPNFKIRLGTGAIALQQSVNDTVDKYQWYILLFLNLAVLFFCSLAYRSIVAGILLLIPVNISNILLASVMVLMGIGLDVNSLPIAGIGIGVGIDYGIYLVSRICEEYRDAQHHGEAIQKAITTSGKAIFFTATIVLISIMPWYFLSDLKFLADMGLLLVMIMLINMVVSLVVLPLLVYFIKPKFVEAEHLLMSEGTNLDHLMKTAV